MSAHSIAEVYAALMRLPVQPRIHPLEAVRILGDNIVPHFEIIPIDKEDYVAALSSVGNGGGSGPKNFYALLVRFATKRAGERIFTLNLGGFRQQTPPTIPPLK